MATGYGVCGCVGAAGAEMLLVAAEAAVEDCGRLWRAETGALVCWRGLKEAGKAFHCGADLDSFQHVLCGRGLSWQ